ncbi:protein PLANT CADMIUM RESISTANCE 8-like [Asparagus officinalis]|uniref:protein PLANT CADMIUM RESISTANCE 8-like n=1 Tax=Asparagus officinalis TaxID=4686 RepID=UPI00098E8077|nr:protein PLANT CADMIUM RESISTANCE 8-like [Asparagus officinalis]
MRQLTPKPKAGQHVLTGLLLSYCECGSSSIEGQTRCTLGSFMYSLMVPALLTCWVLGSNYRQKLRLKYNLVEAPYEDWAVHLFCPCCALCQEYRELERRGLDPSLGWMGHLAKQQYAQTTPPTNQSMTK